MDQILIDLKTDYVRKSEFEPVKSIVFGLVGMVLLAVIGALVAAVLK